MSSDATDGTAEGYVHEPEGGASDRAGTEPAGDFGARGWVLVGIVVLATLVIPGIIYVYPAAAGELGIPFLAAMLALPMVPALLLGATAVWSMTAATSGEGTTGEHED